MIFAYCTFSRLCHAPARHCKDRGIGPKGRPWLASSVPSCDLTAARTSDTVLQNVVDDPRAITDLDGSPCCRAISSPPG